MPQRGALAILDWVQKLETSVESTDAEDKR